MSDRWKTQIAAQRRKGRGAESNPETRFDAYHRERVADGWSVDDAAPPVRTEVSIERPRKIITRNTSPDIRFDRSINPYRGCEHGCVYCFARPSHGYLGLSPGLDFETRLIARPQAPELLKRELRAPSYVPRTIALGTNTDPYQPIEGEYRIMRGILEVLSAFRHPVGIVTRGALIERDIDILRDMAADGLVRVGISVTTLDRDLARKLEPRAPSPVRRLKMIEALSNAGIEVRVMASPMIPGLTDPELEQILKAGQDAGAIAASWILLRLPFEVAGLFEDWLATHMPDRKAKIVARLKESHGGALYRADWGKRMRGEGVFAELIAQRFDKAIARLGLVQHLPPLRADAFRIPPMVGDQLSLF